MGLVMRLLNVKTLRLSEFPRNEPRPPYAIASHRWSKRETSYADVRDEKNTDTAGYQKVRAFADCIKTTLPTIEWLWIDTCCINKDSSQELSWAINSMFEWYLKADICLAYLVDVEDVEDDASFRRSEWFERGWTLQELLAPRIVVFFSKTWEVIGNKGGSLYGFSKMEIGRNRDTEIAGITGMPEDVQRCFEDSAKLTTREKFAWMDHRRTTEDEDKVYALFGIFGVRPGTNYGEGEKGARDRLLEAIRRSEKLAADETERFCRISEWISPNRPENDHQATRNRHEPGTGDWFLKTPQYKAWKSGQRRYLWLHGKAGSGKTVLCSTAIEDIRSHCLALDRTAQVIYYFSFSDRSRQTYEDLIRSMVVQLGRSEPGLSLLNQAYDRPQRNILGLDELHRILSISVTSYDAVFFHVDGLDECLPGEGARMGVMPLIQRLLCDVPQLRMIATSRDYPEIRDRMEEMRVVSMPLEAQAVDSDIRIYVLTQLAEDRMLRRLDNSTKKLIEDTIVKKADAM
jgi:hypothetical protein